MPSLPASRALNVPVVKLPLPKLAWLCLPLLCCSIGKPWSYPSSSNRFCSSSCYCCQLETRKFAVPSSYCIYWAKSWFIICCSRSLCYAKRISWLSGCAKPDVLITSPRWLLLCPAACVPPPLMSPKLIPLFIKSLCGSPPIRYSMASPICSRITCYSCTWIDISSNSSCY